MKKRRGLRPQRHQLDLMRPKRMVGRSASLVKALWSFE